MKKIIKFFLILYCCTIFTTPPDRKEKAKKVISKTGRFCQKIIVNSLPQILLRAAIVKGSEQLPDKAQNLLNRNFKKHIYFPRYGIFIGTHHLPLIPGCDKDISILGTIGRLFFPHVVQAPTTPKESLLVVSDNIVAPIIRHSLNAHDKKKKNPPSETIQQQSPLLPQASRGDILKYFTQFIVLNLTTNFIINWTEQKTSEDTHFIITQPLISNAQQHIGALIEERSNFRMAQDRREDSLRRMIIRRVAWLTAAIITEKVKLGYFLLQYHLLYQ